MPAVAHQRLGDVPTIVADLDDELPAGPFERVDVAFKRDRPAVYDGFAP